jgi:hypothetical protein
VNLQGFPADGRLIVGGVHFLYAWKLSRVSGEPFMASATTTVYGMHEVLCKGTGVGALFHIRAIMQTLD